MFSKIWTGKSTENYSDKLEELQKVIREADAVVIGAGSGLSTSAGYTYGGERFQKLFPDFIEAYHIPDMYTGGFWHYETLEEYWGWWSRHIYYNRYTEIPKTTYNRLLELVKEKDYFVITTNVDHCFQRAGFDKKRLFYMQGDYGLWQCSVPCHQKTYDNEAAVRKMVEKQKDRKVPSELIPRCPVCGSPMIMNLRCDNTFVQDEGWYQAKQRYDEFIRRHENLKIVYLELGVGMNTPVWIKYPFWKMTRQNLEATYVCINYDKAVAPEEIKKQSICIEGDIDFVLSSMLFLS